MLIRANTPTRWQRRLGIALLGAMLFGGAVLQPSVATAQIDSIAPYLDPEPGWPYLVVHSPRSGARYTGASAKSVPVRFDVKKGRLARVGFRVAVFIDGRRYIAIDERPFSIPGLGSGQHTVRFELLDHQGNVVPGGTSVQERTFYVGAKPRSVASDAEVSGFGANRRVQTLSDESVYEGRAVRSKREEERTIQSNGFEVRTGGRREGAVPTLEAPPTSKPGPGNAEFVAPAADGPSGNGEAGSSRSRDRGTTISATLRSNMQSSIQRRQVATPVPEMLTIRTAPTTHGNQETSGSAKSEQATEGTN